MKIGKLSGMALLLGGTFLSWGVGASVAGPSYEPDTFFNDQILPILKSRCFKCHSQEHEAEGGLALDSKAGWQLGGESGPAVKPKDLGNSPLIQAIKHNDPETAMPPKKKLSDYEIALLETWVLLGAPDPR